MEKINGRYRLIRKLGEGGMGKVYLAADERSNDLPVAIKIFKEEKYRGAYRKLVISEFTFLKTLEHENIGQVFDFGFVDQKSARFFTTEFIDGKSFDEYVRRSTNENCLDAIVQICRALNYVHSRGIVHGDIKPSNILVCEREGRSLVKLMDFGLSFNSSGSDDKKTLRGTPVYMAPEVILRQEIDHRIDLYALGITLYSAVYGKLPFASDNHKRALQSTLHEKIIFERQDKWTNEFLDIIRRLVEPYPWNRYSSANDVILDINAKLGCQYAIETTETKQSYFAKPRLLEREKILSSVQNLYSEVRNRKLEQRTNILIRAGRGTGKSRLLDEFKSRAQVDGLFTVFYDCWRTRPNGGLAGHLLTYLREEDETDVAPSDDLKLENSAKQDDLVETELESQKLDLNIRKYGFFKRVSEVVIRAAVRKPVLLLIDDIHLLDKESAEFLIYMIADLTVLFGKVNPQFIMIATISAETQADSSEILRSKNSLFDREISIGNFSNSEIVGEFVKETLSLAAVPISFVSQLYSVTQGNPLLVMEYLSLLAGAGFIQFGAQREINEYIDFAMLDAPSLSTIHLQRLNELSPVSKGLLKWLSCFRYGCRIEVLLDLVGGESQIENYYALVASQYITEAGPERMVSFVNEGLKKSLYKSMGAEERGTFHKRIVEFAEQILATDGEALSDPDMMLELAFQAQQFGDPIRAIRYNLNAARIAASRGSLHQAIQYYEACLIHHNFLKEDARLKVLWNLVHLNSWIGHYTDAISVCNRLKKEAQNAPVVYKKASLKLASIYKDLGHYKAALDIIDELMRGEIAKSDYDRARAENLRATCLLAQSDYETAIRCSSECIAIIDRNPNDKFFIREKGMALANIAQAHSYLGKVETAIELLSEALSLPTMKNDLIEQSQVLTRLGYAYAIAGQTDQSLACYERAYRTVQSIHLLRGQSIVAINLASTHYKLANVEKSLTYFEEAHKTALKMNAVTEQAYCKVNLGSLYRILGLEKMAEEMFLEAHRMAKERGLTQVEHAAAQQLVTLFIGSARLEKIYDWFERLVVTSEKLDKDLSSSARAISLNLLKLTIQIDQGTFEAANATANALYEMISVQKNPSNLDQFYLLKGRLLWTEKNDYAGAMDAFGRGIDAYQASRAESCDFEHLELLMNIHYQSACCGREKRMDSEVIAHLTQCRLILNKMLERIPEKYHKSFLAYNKREIIRQEAQAVLSEEITVVPSNIENEVG